eukprot:14262-Chlamydomonas_euryale.AAC.3
MRTAHPHAYRTSACVPPNYMRTTHARTQGVVRLGALYGIAWLRAHAVPPHHLPSAPLPACQWALPDNGPLGTPARLHVAAGPDAELRVPLAWRGGRAASGGGGGGVSVRLLEMAASGGGPRRDVTAQHTSMATPGYVMVKGLPVRLLRRRAKGKRRGWGHAGEAASERYMAEGGKGACQ